MGSFDWGIFALLTAVTVSIILFVFQRVRDYRARWTILVCMASVFLYSGVGIAYTAIDNMYIISFAAFVLAFCLPFRWFNIKDNCEELSNVDVCLLNNFKTLEKVAVFYLFLQLVPSIYPEFRLFQPFTVRDDYWGTMEYLKDDPINKIAGTLSMLIKPFFYAYLVCYVMKNPKGKKHLIFFLLVILLHYLELHYIARNSIATSLTEFLVLAFCLKGNRIEIKRKHLVIFACIILALFPLAFVYKLMVTGMDYQNLGISYGDMASLMVEQEFTYPGYYDGILASNHYNNYSILNFLLYVICLPIPSFLWPGKPTLVFADSFTYGVLGLSRGDTGFYIVLPSALGESFMVGGLWFSWLFALISGSALAIMTRYTSKHTTLIYYLFYLIVQSATYGRGGVTGLLPTYITGMLGFLIFDFFKRNKF
ncbi:MAG: hypothetical protein KBS72_05235 [Bacteroidales bacterium]|nr:hypothetical protein [Candidatus Cacconaster scatequi]